MRYLFICCLFIGFMSCGSEKGNPKKHITKVEIETIFKDSTLSIRALDFNEDYIFYGSADHYGKRALNKEFKIDFSNIKVSNSKHHFKYEHKNENGELLNFRAIKAVGDHLFAISIASPTKLYKLNRKADVGKLVYEEHHTKAFYDAINFWNKNEGIAIGDPTDDCMSIIITRDAGNTWTKLPCETLPKIKDGEAAFAASNTNIAIIGNHTWVATGGKTSRILYSPNKGQTWEVFKTPIIQGKTTTGIYSIAFYDENNGFAIGGDYTKPNDTLANKIKTTNGGKTWQIAANKQSPGYRSCVQYIPNSEAKGLVTVGFKGIDYSNDSGNTWVHLSDEGFYTIRFINDNTAFAAGKGRICKLTFR